VGGVKEKPGDGGMDSAYFFCPLHLGQRHGGGDEGEVGESLGEVAQHLAGLGVVFLRTEA
jgi:hypothetical protein